MVNFKHRKQLTFEEHQDVYYRNGVWRKKSPTWKTPALETWRYVSANLNRCAFATFLRNKSAYDCEFWPFENFPGIVFIIVAHVCETKVVEHQELLILPLVLVNNISVGWQSFLLAHFFIFTFPFAWGGMFVKSFVRFAFHVVKNPYVFKYSL